MNCSQPNKGNIVWPEVNLHNKNIGWRIKKCMKFDIYKLKMAYSLIIFNWPILQIFWTIGRVSFILGTRRFLKRFSSALNLIEHTVASDATPDCAWCDSYGLHVIGQLELFSNWMFCVKFEFYVYWFSFRPKRLLILFLQLEK